MEHITKWALRLFAVPVLLLVLAVLPGTVAALEWRTETVDSAGNVGLPTSLALDATGDPRIGYFDATNRSLRYAAGGSSGWQIETVDSSQSETAYGGWYPSLVLDRAGNPCISYAYYNGSAGFTLRYAAFDGSAWRVQTADVAPGAGLGTSLALDGADNPVIGYIEMTTYLVKVAGYDGTQWRAQAVAVADQSVTEGSISTSLALDAGGNPRLSFYGSDGASHGGLTYAVASGWSWQTEFPYPVLSVDAGLYSSLALDAAGHPHISYYDQTNGDLKYAVHNGTTWRIETVDSAGNVGVSTSIALDGAGNPRISYYDATNGDLKYAAWSGAGWEVETVDRDGNVGLSSSLELNGGGSPSISYYDVANGDLKFATVALGPPVQALLPVPPSTLAPTDPDGVDGLYDDVNGNGRPDFADVVLYFNQMTWIAANEPLVHFDYNGNGRIDFADVVWLFNNL